MKGFIMNTIWRNFIRSVVLGLLVAIYNILPDLPLSQNEFVELLSYVIFAVVLGWDSAKAVMSAKLNKSGFVNSDAVKTELKIK